MNGRPDVPRVVLRATAAYLPENRVTSATLGEGLGLTEADIVSRTGIVSRRWAAPDQTTATLATEAGRRALAKAGVVPGSVDRVLVSTTSPDMLFPSTACLVQDALGAKGAPAMDVFASCSGFLAALSMARSAILTGDARRVLVIAADVKSRFLDLDDPGTAILFGDGAGAALVEGVKAGEDGPLGRVGPVRLHTDGSRWKWVHMPAGGSRLPASADTVEAGLHTLKMDGIPLFRMAVKRFSEVVKESLAGEAWGLDEVDCFVFHQANLRILEAVSKRLKLDPERVVTTVAEYGNTSSASLPITLDRAVTTGKIGPGSRVLLATFGGGITWGACPLVWD
ncbi:MAG: 3-oxoacyl-ACP synthase III family protein [Leptospirillia bacterium]